METFIKTVSGFGPYLWAVFLGMVISAVVITVRCVRISAAAHSRWTPVLLSLPLLFGALGSVLSIRYACVGLFPAASPDAEIFAWLISRIHVFLGTGATLWFVCSVAFSFRASSQE